MYEVGGEAYPFDEYMIRAGRELGMNELKTTEGAKWIFQGRNCEVTG